MCVNPIQLKKKRPDGSFEYRQVPCGKCEECVSKKHSAFAAECALEARAASSMYFVTLTYDNEHVPVMGRRVFHDSGNDTDVPQECWFEALGSKKRKLCLGLLKPDMSGSSALSGLTYVEDFGYSSETCWNEVYYTPSLSRDDVRLWIKRCRLYWKRQYGEDMNLRYVFFGEYGDQTFRPHYHGLLFNLSSAQAQFMERSWNDFFGFTYFKSVPPLNPDGSSARLKVANYVSKYIAKSHYYFAIDKGLVEAPRRFSSRGFGTACLSERDVKQLKSFTDAKI